MTTTDARGNTRSATSGAMSSTMTDPLGRVTSSSRTTYGLPSTTTFADGATVGRVFDGTTGFESATSFPLTQTDEGGRTRSFTYAAGVLDGVTDLAGAGWSYTHAEHLGTDVIWDVFSGDVRLDASSARTPVSRFGSRDDERDAPRPAALDGWTDQMTSYTTPEGEIRTWSFDAASGRLMSTTHTNGGEETFAYDASSGRRSSQTLPDGTTLTFGYDAAGRVTERTGTDGSRHAWTYGAGGLMTSTTDATGTTTYAHDLGGRLVAQTTPSGAVFAQTHDTTDRLTSIDVGAGPLGVGPRLSTQYGRDAIGHVETLTDPFGRVTTQTFDAADRLMSVTRPNGVTTTFGYDARDRVLAVEHRDASATLLAAAYYTRAASGEPTRVGREDGSYVLVDYDDALRITRERYFTAAEVLTEDISYTYDADGKRTSLRRDGVVDTYVYEPGSELVRVERAGAPVQEFTYDAAGRVTRIQRDARVLDLTYDADDHVIALDDSATGETTSFAFDGDGRRVGRTSSAAGVTLSALQWLAAPNPADGLDSPHLVLDRAADPATADPLGGYVFDERGPFARVDPATDTVVYYLRDAMGSVIGLVSDDGTEHAAIHYDGFGNLRHATGPLADLPVDRGGDFRFQGMWLEPDTGLYYVRARNYDPQTGRFLSRDPAEGVRSDPETFLPYTFARDNPWLWLDPTGRFSLAGQMAAVNIQVTLAMVAMPMLITVGIACAMVAQLGGSGGGRICGDSRASCASRYPDLKLCAYYRRAHGYTHRSLHDALEHVKRVSGDYSARLQGGEPSIDGPCIGIGEHYNVRGSRVPYHASITTCPCCEDAPRGPKRRKACRIH